MKTKWISVKDKKPIDGQLVLTCRCHEMKNIDVVATFQWRTLRYCSKSNEFRCPFQHNTQAPTHWTPLPEPPKNKN